MSKKFIPSQPHKNSPPPFEPCPLNQSCKAAHYQQNIKAPNRCLKNKKVGGLNQWTINGSPVLNAFFILRQSSSNSTPRAQVDLTTLSISLEFFSFQDASMTMASWSLFLSKKKWTFPYIAVQWNVKTQYSSVPAMRWLTPTHSPSFLALGTEMRLTLCSEQRAWTSLE